MARICEISHDTLGEMPHATPWGISQLSCRIHYASTRRHRMNGPTRYIAMAKQSVQHQARLYECISPSMPKKEISVDRYYRRGTWAVDVAN